MKRLFKKSLNAMKRVFKDDTYRIQFYYLFLKPFINPKNKTILYESHHGKSMTCNPYAMYLYMLDNDAFSDYTHIWILTNEKENDTKKNTKYIRRNSFKNAYYLLVSKYLINNTTFLPFFTKSNQQIYINTWHGTPLKTLAKDSNLGYGIHWNVTRNLLQTDFLVSPNEYASEKLLSSSDAKNLYSGKIIENGYPRNDFLHLSKKEQEKLKISLDINNGKKTILYAPTFRGSHTDAENYEEIFTDFIDDLEKKFSNEYNILIKRHHINSTDNQDTPQSKLLDSTDINITLSVVDILITDYSSVSFDFLALKRPIIYYAFDLEKYSKERGFYFPLEEMAGTICTQKQEVYNTIDTIEEVFKNNVASYTKSINKFSKYDDGKTTQKVVEAIFLNKKENINIYKIKTNDKKKLLIYGGAFMLNGVTASLVSLLSNISYEKYEVYLITDLGTKNKDLHRVIGLIPKDVKILYSKQYLLKYFLFAVRRSNLLFTTQQKDKVSKYISENILGKAKFDIAIDYSGYGIYWASIIAYSNSLKKYIYLHSDIKSESKNKRFRYFSQMFKLYTEKFDKLIAVSSTSKNANKSNMPELSHKIECVHNSIDANHIKNFAKDTTTSVLSADTINFINIGRYSVEKGQENLIKAFTQLCKKHKNIHLFIVGHGPLYTVLKDLIIKLKMQKNITLTGRMNNPYALLQECDCFVLSSHYEGQGLVLLESLVLKVPCISTDIPGPRSVLLDDQGLLVPDSIEGLLDGMQSYLEGKVHYKDFDHRKYTHECIQEFYDTIV